MGNHEPELEGTIQVRIGVDTQPEEVRLMGAIYHLIETMLPASEVDIGSARLGRVAAWVWAMWGNGRQPDGDDKQCS